MVINGMGKNVMVYGLNQICRNPVKFSIMTKPEKKQYKIVFCKKVIVSD